MTQLTPALDTALRQPTATVFGAVSISLPNAQINLLDGSGSLSFGGRSFSGRDATYGVMSAAENFSDGTGDDAPAFSLTLIPASEAAAVQLSDPAMQGSPVLVWIGAVSPQTGQVVPDPHLVFAGELDVPTLQAGETGRTVEYEVVSVFERLFEDDESARLSPGHHRSIFPNEAGLDSVTGVAEAVYWGVAGNPSAITYGGSDGSYGGGSYKFAEQENAI